MDAEKENWKVNASSDTSPGKPSHITIVDHHITGTPSVIECEGQNSLYDTQENETINVGDRVQSSNLEEQYYRISNSHLSMNPLTINHPNLQNNSSLSYHEQNNKFRHLNGPLIKDASTNTQEKVETNGEARYCRQRKYQSDKMNESRCAICIHEKLIRSRSTSTPSNAQEKHQHKKYCKKILNNCTKNKARLIDTFPFEIGVKKSQPNLHHQCPPLRPLVQTMNCCEKESTSVISNNKESGLINDSLSKSCSFSLRDNPQSETSLLSTDEIDEGSLRKRY